MTYLYEKSWLPMWGKYVNQRLDNDWDIKFCNWWSMWHFSLLFGLMFKLLPQMLKGMLIKLLLWLLLTAHIAIYVHNRLLASPPQAFFPVSMTLHRYKFILLGGERGIVGVKCFTLEHIKLTQPGPNPRPLDPFLRIGI